MPPTGRTFPRRVISPVIARCSARIGPVASDANAVTMVTPADGPSFGMAPAGTCTWTSWRSKARWGDPEPRGIRSHVRQRCLRALAHHVAQHARQQQPLFGARHHRRLDEQHVTSGRRPGQANRHARALGSLCHLVEEARGPGSPSTSSAVTRMRLGAPSAIWRATLRHTVAIWRSRVRTPASRVYPRMIARRRPRRTAALRRVRPWAASCLGMR